MPRTEEGGYADARFRGLDDQRFWRATMPGVETRSYGAVEDPARNRVNLNKVITHWPDMLKVAGSLVTNQLRAYDLLRMFGRDGRGRGRHGGTDQRQPPVLPRRAGTSSYASPNAPRRETRHRLDSTSEPTATRPVGRGIDDNGTDPRCRLTQCMSLPLDDQAGRPAAPGPCLLPRVERREVRLS
nr:Tn3 family transposase [Streptomyces niphimycinicus]